jgi:serine/threonine protein phosphatase PrpC/pSer/pThr/pTyr-binding forkhead associated (FHA) protein
MISQRVFAAISLPALFVTVVLAAVAAVIVLYILYRFWRQRQSTPSPAAALPPPAATPAVPASVQPDYPVDSTQPNRPVSLPPGMYLVDATGQQFALDRLPATIGRSPQSDFVLNVPTVSYQQARIFTDPRLGLCVEDANSANGLTLDGSPTRKNLLYDGARLGLGGSEYVFRRVGLPSGQAEAGLANDSIMDTMTPSAATSPLRTVGANGVDHTATLPLSVRLPFGPRPRGAIFGDRFQLTETVAGDGKHQRYLVADLARGTADSAWQCNRCGAVHARSMSECSICGAPQGILRPALALTEATTRDFFGPSYDLAARGLAHGGVRAPLAAFEERVGGVPRFSVVAPAVSPLPERVEPAQVYDWGPRLAQALKYLHGVGVNFGGRIEPGTFGQVDGKAVWANFVQAQVSPDGAGRDRPSDVRALAGQLYTWLTGQTQFAPNPTLPSIANEVFGRALSPQGYASAGDLAAGLEQVRTVVSTPLSLDYHVGRRTDVGRMRTLNEDSFLTINLVRNQQSISRPLGVFLVADGMGGHAAGEVASGTIVNQIAQRTLSDLSPANSGRADRLPWLQEVVATTNRKIYDMRQAAGTDMGSTLVMFVLDADQIYVAHVGDSRGYLINAAGITRLTIDHSLVQRLVSTGQITEKEARTHEQRNVIYRTMGDRAEVEVDTSVHTLAAADRVLLCSDGMSGQVEDAVIQQIVMSAATPQAACDALIAAANAAGGPDNITAVLVEVVQA